MAGPLVLYQTGVHGSRPAASAGCVLYSCTTHSLIYKSDGSSWTTFITIPTGSGVATDAIWDAAGDLAVGSGADTAAKLSLGTTGKVLASNGSTVVYAYPPGYELDYVQITSNASITATTEGTANTVITSSAVTFDGAAVMLEFFSPGVKATNTATADITILLRDDTGAAVLGDIGYAVSQAANDNYRPMLLRRRFTPAAGSRTYSIRAFVGTGTGVILAAAGGTGNTMLPAYLRITKV